MRTLAADETLKRTSVFVARQVINLEVTFSLLWKRILLWRAGWVRGPKPRITQSSKHMNRASIQLRSVLLETAFCPEEIKFWQSVVNYTASFILLVFTVYKKERIDNVSLTVPLLDVQMPMGSQNWTSRKFTDPVAQF